MSAHAHPAGTVRLPIPRFCHQCGGGLQLKNIKPGEPERHVCSACGHVHWLESKIAVGAVIAYQGGIVMLQREIEPAAGKWVFPGGFLDRGEALEQAAAREAREEAEIEIGGLELLGAYSYEGHPVIVVVFSAHVTGGTPQAGDEALACEIWPHDAIRWDDLAFRSTREALEAYLAKKSKA